MLRSLEKISAFRQGDEEAVRSCPWLKMLASAEERIINLERITSFRELADANPVLDYVERSLLMLDSLQVSYWIKELLEDVLAWSETAKGGTRRERISLQQTGVNLFLHHIGSAELYKRHMEAVHGTMTERGEMVHALIITHGLLGQHIRGEVALADSFPLLRLMDRGRLTSEEWVRLLTSLNHCIIGAVSNSLWDAVQTEITSLIQGMADGRASKPWSSKDRLRRLRHASIAKGEDFEQALENVQGRLELDAALRGLQPLTLWYVEAALQDFSFEEFLKVLLLALHSDPQDRSPVDEPTTAAAHLSFELLMNDMYYDYKGVKKLNVYKKRMIEQYLRQLDWEDCLIGKPSANPHLQYRIIEQPGAPHTLFFTFEFSQAADKLIDFCIEAEKSPLYEKAVLMLFDLFGLRRDAYDRFHNEESYLKDMNSTGDYKQIILDFITGDTVLDIGPGGGVLLDLIEERMPDVRPIGIDISLNVIEALEKRKRLEGKRWCVRQGDALRLHQYVEPGSVSTVIFSSILHELYSYIETDGVRFNPNTVKQALRSAYDVLTPGGRIIIRDGIMTEEASLKRRIRFLEPNGPEWLARYAADFAGRTIAYEQLSVHEYVMPVNDAMEFLYTYTWGPEAYVHEVQEQFGYFTPEQFVACITQVLGPEALILEKRHYLQDGYTEALAGRIEFMDEQGEPVVLPDSTCLFVIEKPVTP
ncbi:class I SAM-dependent methyltransferase [Paenibacillus sp. JCM 10914]|uniref:class I SAM-dependent methyltransferase n=1 Tax=Paenibacillus sp. JCM 10914 TaxID=1236974 RepID=UPI0003CC65F6|nr:class I SAM-dependent methyltransferase [Paenibacillus sp. JCM 10914]GAE07787.1 SAM-dependent methyltransferases [Paenibacillus sp. JCM 10914]